MPTGYTAAIARGITFDQFVWDCARAFGALVMMRDEPQGTPIPARFEPSPYYATRVSEARAKLTHLRALTIEQAHAECVAEFQRELTSTSKRIQEKEELRAKYTAMLERVDAWQPPTPEHVGLKEFMQKQIRESIDWDCSTKYDTSPECKTTGAWHTLAIAKAELELNMAEQSLREEIERVESRNDWLSALRESVPYPKTTEAK
jgi:hypothetical protein